MDQVPPRTPQRGRSAYPSNLGVGGVPRVPLHRRGTSRTYERLEDLLREAGFKETRVFTPEAERQEAQAEERKRRAALEEAKGEKGKKSIGTTGLVGFLAGFVHWNEGGQTLEDQRSSHVHTQSLGRAAGKQKLISLDDDDEATSIPGTPTPNRQRPFVPVILTSDFSSPGSSSSASSNSPPQQQQYQHYSYSRKQRNNHLTPYPEQGAIASLRHMISAPDISHSRVHQATNMRCVTGFPQDKGHSKRSHALREWGNSEQPPLPQNWLSTVTQAVMNASGAHVGGPRGRQLTQSNSRSKRVESTYEGRSGSGSRKGLAPRTPTHRSVPGIITPASVVCHSAPVSRSSSLVRTRSSRAKRGKRDRAPESCVPSLGITTVVVGDINDAIPLEGEVLQEEMQINIESEDESDDGELDFARLLVPSRRQHSIHSLRRHLHNHAIATGNSASNQFSRQPQSRRSRQSSAQDDYADDPQFMVRSRASIDEDGEADILADWAANGLPGLETAVQKKRGALPWTSWKQGR